MPYNARNHWTAADPNGTSGYDGAGNMLTGNLASASQQSLIYDAEERLTQWEATTSGNTTTVTFTYDGDGRRVKKTTAGGTTVYVYDPAGNLAAEYGGALSNVGGTVYLTQDHLGSTRLVTNQSGGAPQQVGCHDYLPFGEEIPSSWARSGLSCYSQATDAPIMFTGKERDAETGNDNFLARYMSSTQGRFLSVDPEGGSASLFDPQSWNAYSYTLNSPLKFVDQNGEFPILAATALIGAGVGAVGGAGFDAVNQWLHNGHDFSAINIHEVEAAGLGGLVSGGLAGLTLGLLPAPATLTTGYLISSAVVNGGANAVGGVVQREANDILGVPQNSSPTNTGSIAKDFVTGALGGAAGTKVAYVRYPLPNVRKELALIANSNRRSLRPGKVEAFKDYAYWQQIRNTTIGSVVGTSVTNFFSNLLSSWQSFWNFGFWQQTSVVGCVSASDSLGNVVPQGCQ